MNNDIKNMVGQLKSAEQKLEIAQQDIQKSLDELKKFKYPLGLLIDLHEYSRINNISMEQIVLKALESFVNHDSKD